MSAKPLEIESKFEAAEQRDFDALLALFNGFSGTRIYDRDYVTTIRYMDTEGHDLHARGVVLRTMDACEGFFKPELVIKTKGRFTAEGVLTRLEFSFDMPGDALDLSVIDRPEAHKLIAPAKGKKLSEVFNTVTRRHDTCIALDLHGKKAAIDLALDDVSYIDAATGRTLRRAFEMEVEFKQAYSDPAITRAEAEALVGELTRLFRDHARLTPIRESRAETGFRLMKPAA